MKQFLLFFIFSVYPIQLLAWGDNQPMGARSLGMANATVTLSDIYAAQNNQAGLAYIKGFSVGTGFESRFFVPGLSNKSLALAIPTKFGVLGATVNSFGLKNYAENKFGLAYARNFGDAISFGMQLDYLNTVIGDIYGKSGTVAAEVGIIAKLTKSLSIGAHLFNPAKARVANYNKEKAPTIYKIGLRYDFSDKFFVSAEGEKSSAQKKPIFKAGLEYNFYKNFYARTGISGNPHLTSFGLGINLKQLKADMSVSYNNVLGYSSGLSLSWQLFKKQEVTISPEPAVSN